MRACPPAKLDPDRMGEKYALRGVTPDEHSVTSRVTDVNREVHPGEEELEVKKIFLEHNAQLPRTVMIA